MLDQAQGYVTINANVADEVATGIARLLIHEARAGLLE
jgi:hypothetical protein